MLPAIWIIYDIPGVQCLKQQKMTQNRQFKFINAFHTKLHLQQILHVLYFGFGQDITRLKYFYRSTIT